MSTVDWSTQAVTVPDRIRRLAGSLTGWRRWAAAFCLGAAAALALPPVYAWPVLIVSFSGLVLLLDSVYNQHENDIGARTQAAAAVGWWFGFGYFLAGLYWIAWAFLVDAATFAWLIPFAAALMPSGLALFTAVACAVAVRFWSPGRRRILVLVVCWTVFEWLRGHIFTGFPWNLAGYAASGSLALSQTASVVGIYGLSLLVVLSAASFASLAHPGGTWKWRASFPLVATLSMGMLWTWGALRLNGAEMEPIDGVGLRIVQPSFSQQEKWRPENQSRIFQEYLALTRSPGFDDRTHIIWPESALPFALTRSPQALARIVETLGPGRVLITGAVRAQPAPDGGFEFFNSIHAVLGAHSASADPLDHVAATYDKHHLVPFGEYVPFADLFRAMGLRPLVDRVDGFTAGPRRLTLAVPGAPPVSPLICYEIIFPGAVTAADGRPRWIVNVTNDAWYGNTSGPRQHLEASRMRAIESGLPVIRSANTGISAVFDPYGRSWGTLALNAQGVLDSRLPQARDQTIYARFGDIPLFALMLAMIAFAAFRAKMNVDFNS